MKIRPSRILIILILLLFIVLVWNQYGSVSEGFESNPIQMYVISLRHEDRLKNIEKQQEKVGQPIQIFDAVKGDFVEVAPLIASGVLDKKYANPEKRQKREIGCYMSHLQLIQQVQQRSGYTIIFEDDFDIPNSSFLKDVSTILQTLENKGIEFDLLFLGTSSNNKGELVADNIYKQNKETNLWGTYGYLVNNVHIPKILDAIKTMDTPIDNQYEAQGRQDKLTILMVNPAIVNHQDLGSTIGDFSIETFIT